MDGNQSNEWENKWIIQSFTIIEWILSKKKKTRKTKWTWKMKENYLKRKTKQKANEIVEYPSKLIRILCVCVCPESDHSRIETKNYYYYSEANFFSTKKTKTLENKCSRFPVSDIHQLFFFLFLWFINYNNNNAQVDVVVVDNDNDDGMQVFIFFFYSVHLPTTQTYIEL